MAVESLGAPLTRRLGTAGVALLLERAREIAFSGMDSEAVLAN
jgi:hypothetical protein